MHVVYHQMGEVIVVDESSYMNLLLSQDWFDRPQTETVRGNSHETERLLKEQPGYQEPRPTMDGGLRDVLQSPSDGELPIQGVNNVDGESRTESGESNLQSGQEVKRRGRPKKTE